MVKQIFDTWQEKGSTTISGFGTWITDNSGTTNNFDATSRAPSMKYYDPASNSWVGILSTKINLENERGYMIFIRGDRQATSVNSEATPTILRTRGKLYSPDFLPPTSIVPPGRFQSVGNPYASVIDFTKLNSSNIQSSYYAWDPALGGTYGFGGYQTITSATGYTPVPGGTSNYSSTGDYRYIQSGQAFFVNNYTSSEGSVSFPESCKTTGNYRLVNRQPENERQILFANLVSKNGIVVDGNAVSFSNDFSNKIDDDDALKISSSTESFALKSSGKILIVEARKEIKAKDTIFYSLQNLTRQEYKLVFVPQKIRSGFDAYLIDQYLQTKKQISFTDTSIVNFTVTDEKASYNPDRFYLVFGAAAGPLAVSFVSMNAYPKNGNVFINWQVENENDVKDYQLEYSVDGIRFKQIAVISRGNFGGKYNFVHEQPNSSIAFYRIKINKINGESEYEKVIKVTMPGFVAGIRIYPNPIEQTFIHLQFIKQPFGKYRFNLYNTLGQNLHSEELIYKGEAALSIKTMKNLSAGIYQLEIIKPTGERILLKIKNE